MLSGFKNFIMRGNVIDLAVAVVIGFAFKAVVDALIAGFINPLVAAIFGKPNLDSVWCFTINNAEFSIGVILTAVVNFLLIAAAVYFIIVLPMNKLAERRKAGQEPEPEALAEDVLLLTEIRDLLAKQG
jgi:large conductance mechanosensitive channel